jgi:type I restriction enzyme, S subunit
VKSYKIIDLLDEVISGEWGQDPNGENDTKVIRTTNFTNIGRLDLDKEIVKRNIEEQKVEKKKLKSGDIIIEKSGGSPDQPVGRVVYFDIEDNDIYLCNNFTSILRPDSKKVVNKYLFYFLFYQHKIRTVLKYQNKTTGIINLKLENYLNKVELNLPSIEEQHRIVQLLDITFELINKRKAQIESLDQLTQSVFFEMFGDISSNPKNWPLKRLGDFIKITGGFAFKSNEFVDTGIPVIKIGTVNKGYFDLETLSYVSKVTDKYQKYLIYPGDLLITLTGTVGKDDYGNVCIVPNKYNSYLLNQRVAKIEPLNNLDVIYLLYCFKQPTLKREITKLSRGIRQANISNEDINNLVIPLPPIEKQKKFSVIEEKIQLRKNSLIKSLQELENNFNSLMQRAFKGELFNEEKISIS